ncbi:MAG: TonB-dependent receptor [Deltaproteobacteria bacterium]|nr:TonB-dependent receptor [Deltaproteobacteria bacterium]
MRLSTTGLALLLGVLAARGASAEDSAPAVLVPPRIVSFVRAEYPTEAFAAGVEADVLTQIDVDEHGLVTAVEVLEPAGHGFDEAAMAAISQFVFEPATRDGKPIPSRIVYRYRFFAQEMAKPGAADAGPDAGDEPDAGAAEENEAWADAGAEARGAEGDGLFETVVRGRRPPREVTRREITAREITRIPGTGGDALRAVQNMPGTARAAFGSGDIIVRGSAPQDSQIFFDSMPVPQLYHFGGLTSVVNSDLLERIDFYPGNYSVRYGNATGGVVDVTPRAPKTDRLHAYVDADVWDATALAETPIGKDWSVAASVRRSYIDAILSAGDFFDDLRFTVAPRYYDYQVIADYHPSADDNLRLFVFGSDDKMVMSFDAADDNPNMTGDMSMHNGFHQLQVRYDHRFSKALLNQANIAFGYWKYDGAYVGLVEESYDVLPLNVRDELMWDPGRIFVLRTGVDSTVWWGRAKDRVPADYGLEGEQESPLTGKSEFIEFESRATVVRPGWYAELELTAVPDLRVIYGLRIDYHNYIVRLGVDPRVAVRYQLFEHTTLKAGIGLFHQSPDIPEMSKAYGNPDLELISAVHYGLGVEQELFGALTVDVEGFYKDLRNLVTSSDAMVVRDGQTVPERFDNDGSGRVYGMEVEVKATPNDRFFGWIAYTLMRSERRDGPGEPLRLFDYDQTHVLTVVGSVKIGWGVEAGLRFRLASGNPDTPVTGAIYDGDSDLYVPSYGRTNSTRMPLFHQLDLRVDKRWQWDYLALAVYLDVQNVYNRKNPEGDMYNYDYTEKQYFYGLPIIPSLGLKVEY